MRRAKMESGTGRRDKNREERMRRWAAAFLVLEGTGGTIWWVGMLAVPGWRTPFLAPGAPDSTLLALGPADLVFFLGGSFLSAWGLARQRFWSWPALCVHAGAACYAALTALALPLLSGGGWLGALLMAPAFLVLPVLVWRLRPKVVSEERN